MSLEKKITEDMKTAMKNKESLKLETIRQLKSQIKYFQIEKKAEQVDDSMILDVLNRMVKQRKDSIEQFNAAGRTDLSEKEQKELEVLMDYMPRQLTEEEIRSIVEESISESGAETKKDMGKLMKVLMPKIKGKADGKIVNSIVSGYLQ